MKKYFFLWLIMLSSISLSPTYAVVIDKNVDEFAGKRCNTPKKGSGVVVGSFSGMRENRFLSSDSLEPVDRYRCFTTMRECRGWIYTMQSRYSAQPPRFAKCSKF